jgi:hypothetical protein
MAEVIVQIPSLKLGLVINCMKSLKMPKGLIRIRKSKMDRQHNGQKKKDKRTNNNLQNSTQKAKIEQHEPH